MIENPATADRAFVDNADGVVVGVDPLVVRIPQANGPGVTPIPAGDVRPQVFAVLGGGPAPRLGDKVRLIRNIWTPDTWTFSMVLATAPKPPAPTRCPLCGQMVLPGHDYAACEVGSHRPLAEATQGSLG
jgi:hypothetical protein